MREKNIVARLVASRGVEAVTVTPSNRKNSYITLFSHLCLGPGANRKTNTCDLLMPERERQREESVALWRQQQGDSDLHPTYGGLECLLYSKRATRTSMYLIEQGVTLRACSNLWKSPPPLHHHQQPTIPYVT